MARRDTLVHQLADWATQSPGRPAIHGREDGTWTTLTWQDYWEAVRETARGLLALGIDVGDCVAIVGDNRLDWVICEFGIMAARGVPAPIYTTNTEEQTTYILQHCRARIAICDSAHQLAKYLRCIEAGDTMIEHIIVMDDVQHADERVRTLANVRELGRKQTEDALDSRLDALTDTETALLIYTSGTTGVPKAVQLDHGGMLAVASSLLERFGPLRERADAYQAVSYLPLCHVAEQLFTNFLHLGTGGQVYFCPDLKQVKEYLAHARPTLFLGVPRVWEKFQGILEARLAEATGVKARLSTWALQTEFEAFQKEMRTGKEVRSLRRRIAHKLVISKIKTALGLDQLVVAATGAAPISLGTLEFFASIGICIYEGYGMSETSGVASCPAFGQPRFGTVGRPLQSVSVQIADDGEILLKGRNMTQGYLHMPEKTAELIGEDGWLHTGDLGSIDDDGNIRITGRKKDLIITAGGKNIAPAEMESYIQQISGVGQAVVVGDRQPYLSALVTLDPEGVPDLCRKLGLDDLGLAQLTARPELRDYLDQHIQSHCNANVARYQTIKKFHILPVEFSVDGGELTPTMKVKRNIVNDKYADEIRALYA